MLKRLIMRQEMDTESRKMIHNVTQRTIKLQQRAKSKREGACAAVEDTALYHSLNTTDN